ncbi:hypothetical protein [Caldiplasma sukawensis]
MATTKRVKSSSKGKPKMPRSWSIGAVIVALFGTFLLLVSLLSKPQFEVLNHTVVLTQGVVAPAVIMGALVWAIVEGFTPPGKGIIDLLARIIPAFIIGALVGGTLGYLLNFGGYVLNPAFNGNVLALFFLVSTLLASLAIVWEAAWAHTKGFRGQKGKNAHPLNFKESGTSKLRRLLLSLLIIFIAFIVIVPLGAGIGHEIVSGNDNSVILSNQARVTYVSSNTTALPFSSTETNGTYTATFDFPSIEIKNSTGAVISTEYQKVVYIETNLTFAELNNYAASQIILSTNDQINATIEMGTGTNASNFNPVLIQNFKNASSMKLVLTTPELLVNQSDYVSFRMYSNVTSISLKIYVLGNNGFLTVMGPYEIVQFTYILGGVILLIGGIFSLSMYDVDLSFVKPKVARFRGGGKR